MGSVWKLWPVLFRQPFGRQLLDRRREPAGVTSARENVLQYDQVMGTRLALAYAAGLETIYRARAGVCPNSALDLACGPGHYTLCLARYLGYDQVLGLDLSEPMVAIARQNAQILGLGARVTFRRGDVTRLDWFADRAFDLTSFTNAAHHLADLGTVAAVLREMERSTKAEGLVMLMDLVRLRTARLTEQYVAVVGQEYAERGLSAFFEDFRNSMYAAWTFEEAHQAIPRQTRRWWCHLVPRGLPSVQLIVGLPVGRKRLFIRRGVPWLPHDTPVPKTMKTDWMILRMSLRLGKRRWVPPEGDR